MKIHTSSYVLATIILAVGSKVAQEIKNGSIRIETVPNGICVSRRSKNGLNFNLPIRFKDIKAIIDTDNHTEI